MPGTGRDGGHSHEPTFSGNVTHAFSSRLISLRKRSRCPRQCSCFGLTGSCRPRPGAARKTVAVLGFILAPAVDGSSVSVWSAYRTAARTQHRSGAAPPALTRRRRHRLEGGTHDALGRQPDAPDELSIGARIQQKYCDHGLSVAVLTITCPVPRARSSCGSTGHPRSASIFRSANNCMVVSVGPGVTQLISSLGLSPTCGHDRHVQVSGRV